ncbi:MAG: twin-arginine translocase subunit TatC [Brachymonas sp.]|nr:twin-arginine translocase subunit TatC [Brachymonas sp.]
MPESNPSQEDELAGTEQPLMEHLVELRTRLLRSLWGIGLAAIALAIYPGPGALLDFLARPLRAHMPPETRMIAVDVFSPFVVPLKVLLLVAVLAAMPWVVYQIWSFIAPGLYKREKRLALPLIIAGSLLAYTGIAFVQFLVLERMFGFIQRVSPSTVSATPDVAAYVQTLLSLYLAFALAFQVPVIVILLARFGLVSIEKLKSFRRYFIILAFVIAAIVTPPDVLSQLALAIPMCLLYEVGLLVAQWFLKEKTSQP